MQNKEDLILRFKIRYSIFNILFLLGGAGIPYLNAGSRPGFIQLLSFWRRFGRQSRG